MRIIRLLLPVAALALMSGCASKTAGLSEEAQQAKNDRYEYITTVDSRIPQRVLKGQDAATNAGSSPVAVARGERARDLIRPRGLTPPLNGVRS